MKDSSDTLENWLNPLDLILACFSVTDRQSLEELQSSIVPRILSMKSGIPVLLIGLCSNLREFSNTQVITHDEGILLAEQYNYQSYLECSDDISNHQMVFNTIIDTIATLPKEALKIPTVAPRFFLTKSANNNKPYEIS